jgi:hypothetical protein
MMNCVEHGPEHVELELKHFQGSFLKLPSREVIQGDPQAMIDVSAGLAESPTEVLETFLVHPGVVHRERLESGSVRAGGE